MLAAIGFSLDAAGVVSLHVKEYDWIGRPVDGRSRIVELTRLDDLLV